MNEKHGVFRHQLITFLSSSNNEKIPLGQVRQKVFHFKLNKTETIQTTEIQEKRKKKQNYFKKHEQFL